MPARPLRIAQFRGWSFRFQSFRFQSFRFEGFNVMNPARNRKPRKAKPRDRETVRLSNRPSPLCYPRRMPGFNGVRVLSFESRRAKEIAQLISNSGGVPIVAPSTREVPEGPGEDEKR